MGAASAAMAIANVIAAAAQQADHLKDS